MLALLNYRLYRLRRLLVICVLPTLAALYWVAGDVANPELYAFAFVSFLPFLHALIYPSMWYETLSLSIGCVATILLAPLLSYDQTMTERWLWLALLMCFGLLTFCAVLWITSKVLMAGPSVRLTLRTSAVSSLDPASLKAGITMYPGRNDVRMSCGPADDSGLFAATVHTQKLAPSPVDVELEAAPGTAWVESESGEVHADMTFRCKIETSTSKEHHVILHMGDDPNPGILVHRFEEVPGGTRVEMIEHPQGVPFLLPIGMWLEDFFADYLFSEIERVEGRAPVSNRSRTVRQLSVDLAWLMKPFLWSDPNSL